VGIDIEQIQPAAASTELAKYVFSAWEQSKLAALVGARQVAAFFQCWTSKEAYIKGRGDGLSLPLQSFDVEVDPDEPAQLLRDHASPHEGARWQLHGLDAGTGFAAALATRGTPSRLVTLDWKALRST
jgi:4'-phosphopantetheinyl transferase